MFEKDLTSVDSRLKSKMTTNYLNKAIRNGLAAGLAVVLVGCASSGYRKSEKTAGALEGSAKRIEAAAQQLQQAVVSLNDLVNNPQLDLRPQFKKFSAAVGKSASLGTSIRDADTELQARSELYFAEWDKELAAIQNESIRASGQARKLEVITQCNNVRNACLTAQTECSPVLSDLNDIERLLKADLTPGGLAAVRDETARINQRAAPVQDTVNKLVADMRALATAMSPRLVTEK